MSAIGVVVAAIAVFGEAAIASVATITWTGTSRVGVIHRDRRVVLAGLERGLQREGGHLVTGGADLEGIRPGIDRQVAGRLGIRQRLDEDRSIGDGDVHLGRRARRRVEDAKLRLAVGRHAVVGQDRRRDVGEQARGGDRIRGAGLERQIGVDDRISAAGGGDLHVVGPGRQGQVVADRRERHVGQDGLAVDPDVDVWCVWRGVHDTNECLVLCGDRHRQDGHEAEAPEQAEGTLNGAGHGSVLPFGGPATSATGICTVSV